MPLKGSSSRCKTCSIVNPKPLGKPYHVPIRHHVRIPPRSLAGGKPQAPPCTGRHAGPWHRTVRRR
ncbi:hypothetical protein [Ralstonia phage phiITL-1]|uniref:Uncharacterized protein n=1 Tax=Ralstonia phage phiITL-1 TaxID=1597967 RepID=A0A0U1ZH54_9CAUD|nr:hypothetical protein HOR02_gp18 [Ralstonia phage phiITL-1]AJT60802.1 hypothetical protein [Ralstonia phage phiITL-1]